MECLGDHLLTSPAASPEAGFAQHLPLLVAQSRKKRREEGEETFLTPTTFSLDCIHSPQGSLPFICISMPFLMCAASCCASATASSIATGGMPPPSRTFKKKTTKEIPILASPHASENEEKETHINHRRYNFPPISSFYYFIMCWEVAGLMENSSLFSPRSNKDIFGGTGTSRCTSGCRAMFIAPACSTATPNFRFVSSYEVMDGWVV
jgi:hypothetical protein